ncbi:MAG: hypothetical protein ACR2RV_28165, partial [Verrucomicrobiales bacterium]
HDTVPAVERIGRGLNELAGALTKHIEWEDEHLAKQVLERLDLAQQGAILTRIHAETPAWIAPRLLGWMVSSISSPHRAALLDSWMHDLPADDFARNALLIHGGVDEKTWDELVSVVPGLEAALAEG